MNFFDWAKVLADFDDIGQFGDESVAVIGDLRGTRCTSTRRAHRSKEARAEKVMRFRQLLTGSRYAQQGSFS